MRHERNSKEPTVNVGRVLGLIPARGGSKGIPRKNIRELAGKPLIHYACEAARASRHISRTIVSTDCPEIAACAEQAGVEAPFLRPAELADDKAPTVDVLRHALKWLDEQDEEPFDIVVLLQPTAPLRLAIHVDESIGRLIESNADAVVSVSPVPDHYHPDWQLRMDDGILRPWTRPALSDMPTRRQQLTASYTRNGAVYAFRRAALDRTGSFYGNHCVGYAMPAELSVNIDTAADWDAAEAFLRQEHEAKHAAA